MLGAEALRPLCTEERSLATNLGLRIEQPFLAYSVSLLVPIYRQQPLHSGHTLARLSEGVGLPNLPH